MNPMDSRMGERRRLHLLWAIFLIAGGLHCPALSAPPDAGQIANEVSVDSYRSYLQNDLYAHAGDERAYGPKHDLARRRIQEIFEGFGLATSLDPFVYSGGAYYNVVGVHTGVTRPREIYILGAHYDSVVGAPGAVDNASGVAGVLEAARVMSQYLFEATVIFIAFDREEQRWRGSAAYANAHAQDDIRGMIAFDMIAYQPAQPQDTYAELWYTTQTEILDDLAVALQTYAELNPVLTHTVAPYGSDYLPFDTLGFPAALLIQYAPLSYPFYHTPSDSLDKLDDGDYDYATQITRAAVGYLAAHAGIEPVRAVPDFNGDWKVDIEDLTALIDHWGLNDPALDIAPVPSGDGVVDKQDLEGLMHYWNQEIPHPALAAYWKLDETEGTIAHDSMGKKDATLMGTPIWQPAGGKIGGALQFDGSDGYVSTERVLDPETQPLAVFAWVQGGVPGQVILSQDKGANWLVAATPGGELTTELRRGRRGPLSSAVIVTDGAWHRVGLVCDGVELVLYVDDVEVARDSVLSLSGGTGGLHLGAGKGLEPGSFWSGLIDDVRIYDQAVMP